MGWLRRIGPWVGMGTSPAALMLGGGVGEGLEGGALVIALVVGVTLLTTLACVQGMLGQSTGLSLARLTAGPLGVEGSRRTASVVMLAMMLGWFGVNVGVAGVALARLVGVPDTVGVIAFSAIMLVVAGRGLGVLSWSATVAGVATVVLAAWGLHLAFADRELTLSGGEAGSHPTSILTGVVLVVGYGSAFSLRAPDFTHDLGRMRQVLWCALVGLAVPVLIFGLAGAALQAATGNWDLADVMRDLGSPELAYLFVAVGFTGSVLTNIWSGGLSLTDARPAAVAADRPDRRRLRRRGHRGGRLRRPDAALAGDHGARRAGAGRRLRHPRPAGRTCPSGLGNVRTGQLGSRIRLRDRSFPGRLSVGASRRGRHPGGRLLGARSIWGAELGESEGGGSRWRSIRWQRVRVPLVSTNTA